MKFNLACLLIAGNLILGKDLRIIGGGEVQKFQYPFVVSLQKSNNIAFCGGSLLDSTTVITAAHCTTRKAEEVYVHVHRHDLRLKPEQEKGAKLKVKSVHPHPLYGKQDGYDIAIWKLVAPIPKNITVKYITLDTNNLGIQTGLNTIAAGWGRISQDGSGSKVLKSVAIPIYDNNECRKVYGDKIIKGKIVCAGSKTEDKSTCKGDSGGPLFFIKGGEYIQVGLTAFGIKGACAKAGIPKAFTSIYKNLDFIREKQKMQ